MNRYYRQAQLGDLEARDLWVRQCVRRNQPPPVEEEWAWVAIMSYVQNCVVQNEIEVAQVAARLLLLHPDEEPKRWAYGVAQAGDDLAFAFEVFEALGVPAELARNVVQFHLPRVQLQMDWSNETAAELRALAQAHEDAEEGLIAAMSRQIAMEIDAEIMHDLRHIAELHNERPVRVPMHEGNALRVDAAERRRWDTLGQLPARRLRVDFTQDERLRIGSMGAEVLLDLMHNGPQPVEKYGDGGDPRMWKHMLDHDIFRVEKKDEVLTLIRGEGRVVPPLPACLVCCRVYGCEVCCPDRYGYDEDYGGYYDDDGFFHPDLSDAGEGLELIETHENPIPGGPPLDIYRVG